MCWISEQSLVEKSTPHLPCLKLGPKFVALQNPPQSIFLKACIFLLKPLQFRGPCNNRAITISIDGTLVAPSDIGNAANWLLFEGVDGVSIRGGTLDGRGKPLWACKKSGKNCPRGATTLGIRKSKNVKIGGLRSVNSKMFHIVMNGCENVKLEGVKVKASGNSPNTDGIHVQHSTGVTISSTKISTGDDCVSIGPGATNLWIENVVCGPGHGISIGSLGKELEEAGVENVTVKRVRFKETLNGVRIRLKNVHLSSSVVLQRRRLGCRSDPTIQLFVLINTMKMGRVGFDYFASACGGPMTMKMGRVGYN